MRHEYTGFLRWIARLSLMANKEEGLLSPVAMIGHEEFSFKNTFDAWITKTS